MLRRLLGTLGDVMAWGEPWAYEDDDDDPLLAPRASTEQQLSLLD